MVWGRYPASFALPLESGSFQWYFAMGIDAGDGKIGSIESLGEFSLTPKTRTSSCAEQIIPSI
jgi:hypothetical protein